MPRDAIQVTGGTLTRIVPAGKLDGRQFDVTVVADVGSANGGVNTVRVKANGFTLASGVLSSGSNEITVTVDNQGPQVKHMGVCWEFG